jgi:hypothetical protein
VYLCVPYGSQNKQLDSFPKQHEPVGFCSGDGVFPVRYELNLYIKLRRNSVFKGLNKMWTDHIARVADHEKCCPARMMISDNLLRGGGIRYLRDLNLVTLRYIFLNGYKLYCPEILFTSIYGFSVSIGLFS